MNKKYQIGLVLSATDKMSSVINKAFGGLEKKLTGFSKKAAGIAKGAAVVSLGAGAVSAGILAPMTAIVDKAIQFEDKMADVAKVTNLKNGSKELEAMGKSARDTAVYLAKMPTDVAGMYAELAQGGVAVDQLKQVARTAGEVAVAFDMDASLAGDKYIKIQNALGTTLQKNKVVFDAINALSDKTAAKASQITDYLASGGAAVAKTLGISGEKSAALGSVFISMGKSGEEAATIFERMTKGMMNMDKASGKVYAKAGGGMAGLLAVVKKGQSLTGTERFKFFRDFGEYGNDVSQLANNYALLEKHLGFVADEQLYLGSVNKEFQNRMGTTGTKLRQAKSQLESLAIEAGSGLLPAIKEILLAVTPMLQKLAKWMSDNPKLTAQIAKGAVAVGVFAAGISVVSGLFSGLSAGAVIAMRAFAVIRTGVLAVRTAMLAMNAAMLTNPIVLGVAAIAAAAFLIYKYWEPIKGFFSGLWLHIKAVFGSIVNGIGTLGTEVYEGGKNIFKQLARGLMETVLLPVKPIIYAVDKIRGFFPHSPAKYGPLKDLHRVDIFGQVARGVNPMPLQTALTGGINSAMPRTGSGPVPVTNNNNSSSGGAITFAPVINITGGGPGVKNDVIAALKQCLPEFERLLREVERKNNRLAF